MWKHRRMKSSNFPASSSSSNAFVFFCAIVTVAVGHASSDKAAGKEGSLSAKELLKTISADYHTPTLPPGFPPLEDIQTNLFNFKTSDGFDRVSATLVNPVAMYPHYVQLMKIGMNFTYDKDGPNNDTWKVDIKGTWPIGSTFLPVTVSPKGEIKAEAKRISLDDLISAFLNKKENVEIGLDTSTIVLTDVIITAKVPRSRGGVKAVFSGILDIKSTKKPTRVNITLIKSNASRVQLYSVMHFKHVRPKKILKEILHRSILQTPFFAHMLQGGDLFAKKKGVMGLTFSFNEVYHHREKTMAGHIIRNVLQSHIPAGVTLLSHIKIKPGGDSDDASRRSGVSKSKYVKVAFVINQPAFDLLLSEDDRILVSELLPALSDELSSSDHLQRFNRSMREAYTTHVSFDSLSTVFSIFVRLKQTIELMSPALKINVTNLALQKNIGLDDKRKIGWKVSAKGVYSIGGQRVRVKYSELTDEPGESFGLTGTAHELSLDSILDEFKPTFYPNDEVRTMVENTEVGQLKLYKVRIYSRGSDSTSTPHLLITGLANLPQWEKEIQVALLLLHKDGGWMCKWAASLKNSPLSNILQALTGFDTRNLKILHNNHIITTIISSPLPSYSMLPSYIITTRLLRLPVQKALTVVALLPFPDNCGDDKMCESATGLLDTTKVYTVSGVLGMQEYQLKARLPHTVNISDNIIGTNNTLQFSIGNISKMEITTSFKLPSTDYAFDGALTIDQNGVIEIEAASRQKEWTSPFGMKGITFENMKLSTSYRKKRHLTKLNMVGTLNLGLRGAAAAATRAAAKKRTLKVGLRYYGRQLSTNVTFIYDILFPTSSKFFANFTDITIGKLLGAYYIDVPLPNVLYNSIFPHGLVVSHGGQVPLQTINTPVKLEGFIDIFGRLLNCSVYVIDDPRSVNIVTEHSPAPLLFAKGEIIVQKDAQSSLQGPQIVASIDSRESNVSIRGFVKVLGMEGPVDISIVDNIKFTISGKLMDYKETTLTASSTDTLEQFQVSGCLKDVAFQVQILLVEIITKSANQSVVNKRKAESNYLNAQNYNEVSDHEETILRTRRDHDRARYEEHLLEYGRFEVKVNDTCLVPACEMKCFGCPRLDKCCRLDIFGHCIACSSWKPCCWRNVNPLCISKQDGCDVIRTAAQRSLAEKEDQILQERIELDNLELHVLKSEVNKGKHEAVLEAAIDAKQLVEEDSSPGLNAHDAIKSFGPTHTWAKINSVCYNTSIEQAATGCMKFIISAQLFKMPEQNLTIWSCLKDDLVTELAESLANLIFPNIVDTTDDGITEVAEKLNGAKIEHHLNQLTASSHKTQGSTFLDQPIVVKEPSSDGPGPNMADAAPSHQQEGPSIAHSGPHVPNTGPLTPAISVAPSNQEGPSIANAGPLVPNTGPLTPFDADDALPQTGLPDKVKIVPVDLPKKPHGKVSKVHTSDDEPDLADTEKEKDVFHAGESPSGPAFAPLPPPKKPSNSHPSVSPPGGPIQMSEPEIADGWLPTNSDAPPPKNKNEKEMKSIYESGGSQQQQQQDTTEMLPSEEESVADQIIEDEEKEEEKGVKDAVDAADRDMSRIVQNETDLMLHYEFGPQKAEENGRVVDGSKYVQEPGPASFAYQPRGKNGENDQQYEEEEGGDPERDDGVMLRTEYPADDGLRGEEFVYPWYERERKRRDVKPSDEVEGDLMVEEKHKEEEKKRKRRSSDSSSSSKTSKKETEKEWERDIRSIDDLDEDLMILLKKEQDEKDKKSSSSERGKRSRRSIDEVEEPTSEKKNNEEEIDKRVKRDISESEEMIDKRLKRDISAMYEPEDLDEVFKQTLNEQHQHREKRSHYPQEAPTRNRASETSKRMLFSKPFWDVRPDRRRLVPEASRNSFPLMGDIMKGDGGAGGHDARNNMMSGMLKKRWKIPDNSNGRCHIYHQLIAICKDMADTIVTLDKALNRSRSKFLSEDKDVYMELFDTEEYLINAAKKINISQALTKEAEKTLTVVQQGVNIWSRRCTSEFEWQNKSGVQTWIQAMDFKIQELGGFGVYRFLENLFHAFQALFEVLTLGNTEAARDAIDLLHRTHSISKNFDRIFKDKLSVSHSRIYANQILAELEHLKKDSLFC